ncbi:hypothetical protein LTR70_002863 [Exophiala xenobiotica]|uniref:Cytidyltransferase-like domain-containing protein n=1 Tax=Lithohypha guttulata TaxID=1690604 RepID=A0ABR0KJ16_9EURO|nr:hypothetical protein LTR24_002077 [Lithohypha guttulata]KAK5324579.1 hypothetical protein LTR70_002863 [Exophiala xenobiotica]
MSTRKALLFLPALQLPIPRDTLRTVYRDAVEAALRSLQSNHNASKQSPTSRLDIAILFDGGTDVSRSELFHAFQTLLAELYTLICITATSLGTDLDITGGIDARILALDAPYSPTNAGNASERSEDKAASSGPLSSMAAFVASRRDYNQYLFCVLTDTSHDFRNRGFREYWKAIEDQHNLSSHGPSNWHDSEAIRSTITDRALTKENSRKHFRVAVGGTFDHLHIGHKLLLSATISIAQPGSEGREITVGITGDELLVNKKHASVLESWDTRQQRSAEFVESILVLHPDISSVRNTEHFDEPGPNGKIVKVTYDSLGASGKVTINYVRISDPFGPTITDESISALVISAETRAGGKAVNDRRTEKGWAPLEVFEVDVLDAGSVDQPTDQDPTAVKTSFESKISSTEIRRRLATGEVQAKST